MLRRSRRLVCALLIATVLLAGVPSAAFAYGLSPGSFPSIPGTWWGDGKAGGVGNFEADTIVLYPGQRFMVRLTSRPAVKVRVWLHRLPDARTPQETSVADVTGSGSVTLDYSVPGSITPEPGRYKFVMGSMIPDGGASQSAADFTYSWSAGDPRVVADIWRLAGSDRYATALAVSSRFATASAVIVASGANFPDALAASGLAGSYDCPVLLTPPTTLYPGITAEIARLRATKVFVVGGPAAISDKVVTALGGPTKVTRLGGGDRYETAAKIAAEVRTHEGAAYKKAVFVATGANFPDALGVSAIAFRQKMPILLVSKDAVPASTSAELAAGGVTQAHVVGSASVIDKAFGKLAVASKERLAGSDRYLTAFEVAKHAVASGWASWDDIGMATGENFPDALGGGAECGRRGGVILLARWYGLPAAVWDGNIAAGNCFSKAKRVRYYGGTNVLVGTEIGDLQYYMLGGGTADWNTFGPGTTTLPPTS